jgi:hypothetical protein
MRRERLLQFLSVAIIFTGGTVTRAHARESSGCTGIKWANLPAGKTCVDYPDDPSKKSFCDKYFDPPNTSCGEPDDVECGEDGENGFLMACEYGY